MATGLYSGVSGLALGTGLYRNVPGLWGGAPGLINGFDYAPSLYLDFLTGAPLDGRITFTRGSTATFVGSDGLIQTAAISTPRFDYDPVTLAQKGLLIEEQRANLLTYSAQFDNVAWNKTSSTITADAAVSPDGAANADKLVEDTTTSTHRTTRSVTASASTTYTQSIFIKAAGRTNGQLQLWGNSGGSTVSFDLTAGTATAAGAYGGWSSASTTITYFGGGWYRITNTATTNAGLTAVNYAVLLADAAGNTSYTGNGVSGVLIYGAQFEVGSFATSYIPTVASTATRLADIATVTGTNFSSWYNQSEGTMACNFSMVGLTNTGGTAAIWLVNDGSSANSTRLREGTVISGVDATMLTGNVTQVDSNSFAAPINTVLKAAFAWSSASSNLTANGASLGEGGVITPPTVNQLVLTGSNKHLRSLAFYPTRLTNAQLRRLTA